MDLKKIESEAMHLSAEDRAAQLDSGAVDPVPSDVVLKKAQALIK